MTLKHLLAASLAVFATQAHGMTLNPRGVGQVLIYPYYTVNAHQQTLFTLTNATENGKAVQVTFREAYDGRVVYAQDIFLGANQSWDAGVFALRDIGVNDDGVGITSNDKTCTQTLTNPAAPTTSTSGIAYHLFDTSSYTGAHADGGPVTASRLHEGYIEVIELGVIAGGTALQISPRSFDSQDCSAVVPSLTMIGDLLNPTGGLSGSAAVVNVARGTFLAFEPAVIDGFRPQRIVPPTFADLGMAGSEVEPAVSASI
jgi:hypothetical protein